MLRKTRQAITRPRGAITASMRPQRNAAENGDTVTRFKVPDTASMRPQRNAAENMATEEEINRVWWLQ